MVEFLRKHAVSIIIIGFILFNILKPDKPTEFKRWAYIVRDENATQWERVIAYVDSQDNGDVGVWFYVYAIEYPGTGKVYDAMATYPELSTDEAALLSFDERSGVYYIRLTDEEVK